MGVEYEYCRDYHHLGIVGGEVWSYNWLSHFSQSTLSSQHKVLQHNIKLDPENRMKPGQSLQKSDEA